MAGSLAEGRTIARGTAPRQASDRGVRRAAAPGAPRQAAGPRPAEEGGGYGMSWVMISVYGVLAWPET